MVWLSKARRVETDSVDALLSHCFYAYRCPKTAAHFCATCIRSDEGPEPETTLSGNNPWTLWETGKDEIPRITGHVLVSKFFGTHENFD
jgi:hypothetical protein